ncbi:hypothetical protein CP01DC11_0298B, partial [Chlamydia psittaci 01DC11]
TSSAVLFLLIREL